MTKRRRGIEVEGLVGEFKGVRAVDGLRREADPNRVYGLFAGRISTIVAVNPLAFILQACRGFAPGEPTGATFAFGIGTGLVLLFIPWALFGLWRTEKAG